MTGNVINFFERKKELEKKSELEKKKKEKQLLNEKLEYLKALYAKNYGKGDIS